MSTADAAKLQRALSTVTGLEEMKLTFIARPDFPRESNSITKAFSDLRGVGIASVCGPGSRHSLGIMTRIISSPLVDNDAIKKLAQGRVRDGLSKAQAHQTNQEWHKTAAACETLMAYIIDCQSIYFRRIRRDSKNWRFLYDTNKILFPMLVEATFWIGDYDAVVSYTKYIWGSYDVGKPILVGSVHDFRRRAVWKLEERGVITLEAFLYRSEQDPPLGPSIKLPNVSGRFASNYLPDWQALSTDSSTDVSD